MQNLINKMDDQIADKQAVIDNLLKDIEHLKIVRNEYKRSVTNLRGEMI